MKKPPLTQEQLFCAVSMINQKLTTIANSTKKSMQALRYQYLQERFLYQLSQSAYKNKFILKDYSLLENDGNSHYRPVTDLRFQKTNLTIEDHTTLEEIRHIRPDLRLKDLTVTGRDAVNKENDIRWVENAFREICDGVLFDGNSLQTAYTVHNQSYKTIKITLQSHFGPTPVPMVFFMDFENFILPKEKCQKLPVLDTIYLADIPAMLTQPARLARYALETVAAEKIYRLAHSSSAPLREFYSIHRILTKYPLHKSALKQRIQDIFKINRKNMPTDFFWIYQQSVKKQQAVWKSFLDENE